jgi:alkylhydroperoxidase family enzyme
MSSHAAAARELFADKHDVVDCVIHNQSTSLLSDKMNALLNIAGKVQESGKRVTAEDILEARNHGATDRDIHDTVLIAATFSMFNRYVDGLASLTPTDPKEYEPMGKRMATMGYVLPQQPTK